MLVHIKYGLLRGREIENHTFEAKEGFKFHTIKKSGDTYIEVFNRHHEGIKQGTVLKVIAKKEDVKILEDGAKVVPIKKKADKSEILSDEDLYERIKENFSTMESLIRYGCAKNKMKGLVISGAPGVGKSYEIQKILHQEGYEQTILEQNDDEEVDLGIDDLVDKKYYVLIKGRITPLGLYKTLHDHKDKIIVFDDCDSVLGEMTSLNLLKAALDSYERRFICWNSRAVGHKIPRKFEFTGTIIFISNIHFDMIKEGSKLRSHIDAIMSRCHFLDLSMKSNREKIIRLNQVIKESDLFYNYDFTDEQKHEIVDFIIDNQDVFREISLRTALKVADIRVIDSENWQKMALMSCLGGSPRTLIVD